MKRYTTFEEINRDLKYLRLKSKIDFEEVKFGIQNSKEDIQGAFSPVTLIANTVGSIIKKTFVLKVVDKIIGGINPFKKKK